MQLSSDLSIAVGSCYESRNRLQFAKTSKIETFLKVLNHFERKISNTFNFQHLSTLKLFDYYLIDLKGRGFLAATGVVLLTCYQKHFFSLIGQVQFNTKVLDCGKWANIILAETLHLDQIDACPIRCMNMYYKMHEETEICSISLHQRAYFSKGRSQILI